MRKKTYVLLTDDQLRIMVNEAEIKRQLIELVKSFRANYAQHKKELESNTETKLIEPLFIDVLGWTKNDFEKTAHARREGKAGFPDYAFKLNGRTVFYVEVKKVGVDLEKEANKQVISYALSVGGVPFAISTNFEELRIFCVEEDNAVNNVFRVFKRPEDYIERFHDLLYLHKENFKQNRLLKLAEEEGRLKKRVSIDKPLLEDLMSIRNMIANDIEKRYHGKYELNEREEIIQRIIDRLIFIRKCEDAEINPENLTLKETRNNVQSNVYPKLKILFKEYDNIYNSGLFAIGKDNDCDKIEIEGEIVQKLIDLLYKSKDGQYFYDFEVIGADILGQVYEQYLGKILAQTKSGKSKLTDGQVHRKEQGIFYTPTYIVDYIVDNTLGNLLRDRKTDAKRIKVLDPACGSGSFLIKAFDYLKENLYSEDEARLHRIDEQGLYSIKTAILKDNIYGVDLDAKAVEITKLNLLLKAAEKYRRLPEDLDLHIRHGNSLINDESVAGFNAFKWEGQFQAGSFDVVIGNPPYVRQEEFSEIKTYLQENYTIYHGMSDLFVYFFEREMSLLKDDGRFGMIVSNKWLRAGYGASLRRFISRFWIEELIDFGDLKVFPEATIYPCIIIIRKLEKSNPRVRICRVKTLDFLSLEKYVEENHFTINQIGLGEKEWNIQNAKANRLIEKLESSGQQIEDYVKGEINYGIKTGFNEAFVIDETTKNRLIIADNNSAEIIKPFLIGAEIKRYSINSKNLYLIFTRRGINIDNYPAIKNYLGQFKERLTPKKNKDEKIGRKPGDYKWYEIQDVIAYHEEFKKPKIVWGNLALRSSFAYDDKGFYVNAPGCILPTDSKYILGLLNSRLISFYLKSICAERQGGYIEQKPVYIRRIPIAPVPESKQQLMNDLVEKILFLNARLGEIGIKKTGESAKINEEINLTDAEINRLVYEIYGLTKEEIQIIEESVSSASERN